jgi:hypothetical protein
MFSEQQNNSYILKCMERKPDDKPAGNNSGSCISKEKLHKHDQSYLSFGFTSILIKSKERSRYVSCLSTLAADNMKPNKLKRHPGTKHLETKNKSEEWRIPSSVDVKMEAIRSSETSVNKIPTRRHIPEDGIFHSHRSENPQISQVRRIFPQKTWRNSHPAKEYCVIQSHVSILLSVIQNSTA